jgi:hypothetical protein
MTSDPDQAPALVGIGAQSIVDRAKSLGLTWTLRPGSIATDGVSILYDGDTEPINAVNLTGDAKTSGDRVMGLTVPPSGNFIIGVTKVDPWHTPVLLNGWVDYDTTVWQGARYRKLSNGMVTIQGLVKNGTGPPSDIFFLPVGYRPAKNLLFASIGNNVFARVDVYLTGSVNWSVGGTNGFVSISLSFFAGP